MILKFKFYKEEVMLKKLGLLILASLLSRSAFAEDFLAKVSKGALSDTSHNIIRLGSIY